MPRLRAFLTKEKEKAGSKSSGPELLNPILEAESENVLYGAREISLPRQSELLL